MVTDRQLKLLEAALKFARALLVLALPTTAAALIWTAPTAPDLDNPEVQTSVQEAEENQEHTLSWYAPLWQRDLKQPPIQPATSTEPEGASAPSGPVPKLLATLVEPAGSYAHLIGRQGAVELKAVGDLIDGFRIAAIEPGRVQLDDGKRTIWIEVPRREDT